MSAAYSPRAFAMAVQQARAAHGVSARVLGMRVGVKHTTILRIERGEIMPTSDLRQRLANALEAMGNDDTLLDTERARRRDHEPVHRDYVTRLAVRWHRAGLSIEQIAELMRLGRTEVYRDLESALRKLRELAEQEGPEGDAAREWIELVLERAELQSQREGAGDLMGTRRGDGCRHVSRRAGAE